jgi:hypothetical protein
VFDQVRLFEDPVACLKGASRMVLRRGRRWLPRILSNRAEARSIFDELSRRLLQRSATKPTLRFGTTMSHSIDEIERLVSAEIKMRKVSERSVLVGRMKLEDAMLAPFEFNDRAAAWRQSFHETLCGGASDRSSVKFHQGNAAMIRDVQIRRLVADVRKSRAARKRNGDN